jgi:epoxyqueuosine reductase
VRGAAVWALSRLMAPADFAVLRQATKETDPQVLREWHGLSA